MPSIRRRQRGYLLELPVLLMILLVGAAMLLPRLTPAAGKVLVGMVALPVLVLLYIMIVRPGWQPGGSGVRTVRGRIALFVCLAAALVAGVLLFALASPT
jgi:hypothetical protein